MSDSEVGFHMPVSSSPPLTCHPVEQLPDPDKFELILEQVETLIAKEAVEELPLENLTLGYYFLVFLRSKKNSGKWELIHDLKEFNSSFLIQPPYLRLLTLGSVMRSLEPLNYMISLDLQDAYLHIPICTPDQRYFCLILVGCYFPWNVFPFGISSTLWLFTWVTQPIIHFLHKHRMYLDDGFCHKHLPAILEEQRDFVILLLRWLGWLVTLNKSDLVPTKSLQFLGAVLDTAQFRDFVPHERMTKLQSPMTQMNGPLSLHQWQKLLGLLMSAQDLMVTGRLLLRPL
ncbi:uncharacterized protein [Haliotis asinina]|uniref:uncharacterized protein n=1 Tax=Haliotis asinina TaxID=109174 RepID=UPI003531A527